MKKLEFKPETFKATEKTEGFDFNSNQGQRNAFFAAERAQAKFDEWFKQIENAPLVYGICEDPNIPRLASLEWTFMQSPKDTHTARLVDIQEIKKKCEKHEPIFWSYIDGNFGPGITCKHCCVELVAEWYEKK